MTAHTVTIALVTRGARQVEHDFTVEVDDSVIGADLLAIGRGVDAAYAYAEPRDMVVAWVCAVDGRRLDAETNWIRLSEEAGA